MKNLNLHPMSALVGAGVVLLAGVLSAQHVANRFVSVRVLETPTLEIAPHPRDAVRIYEGTSFTVPSGRILIVNALGSLSYSDQQLGLSINGVQVMAGDANSTSGGICRVPFGLTAGAGDVVDVWDAGGSPTAGFLLGYLVDA